MQNSGQCIFSVDVEDWFHILDVPAVPEMASWSGLPSRVEANFLRLLDVFSEQGRQVTCFFVGWIAEHFHSWSARPSLAATKLPRTATRTDSHTA